MNSRIFLSKIEDWNGKGILSIVGPTASGKTALTLDWVRNRFPVDLKTPLLVSVDSVAVYQGLDIGSAKPMGADRADFDWQGLDLAKASDTVNARSYVEQVTPAIERALRNSRPILLVGGSLFYERALVEGMSPGDPSAPDYLQQIQPKSNESLWAALIEVDSRWKDRLHVNDRYRLERYSDLVHRQGLTFEELIHQKKGTPLLNLGAPVSTLVIGAEWSRDEYAKRLESRIHEMMKMGWLDEVKALSTRFPSSPALQSVGYQQISEGLGRGDSVAKIKESVLTSHLQLVKKQKTWIRGILQKSDCSSVKEP
jgi:tRNA dimethylallyltransferase